MWGRGRGKMKGGIGKWEEIYRGVEVELGRAKEKVLRREKRIVKIL